jgi:hypothetical protein
MAVNCPTTTRFSENTLDLILRVTAKTKELKCKCIGVRMINRYKKCLNSFAKRMKVTKE